MLMLILAEAGLAPELHRRRRRHRRRHRRPVDRRRVARRRGRRERRHPPRAAAARHDPDQRRGRPPRPLRHVRGHRRRLRPLPRPDRRAQGAVRRRRRCAPTWPPATARSPTALGAGADVRAVDVRVRRRLVRVRRRAPRRATLGDGRSCRCAACTTCATPPGAIAMALELGVAVRRLPPTRSARFGGVARRFDIRGVDGGATFVDDYAPPAGRDRRRARRRPRQRRRLASGSSPCSSPTATTGWPRCRRSTATRSSTPTSSCSPTSTRRARRRSPASPASSSSTPCSTPTRDARVVWLPRRDDLVVVPRRRGRPRRRVHLDGLRRHRLAPRRGARPARRARRRVVSADDRRRTAVERGGRAMLGRAGRPRRAARRR